MMPYAESGAAVGVYKKENIERAIRDILDKREVRQKLKNARNKFIDEHLFGFDGQATPRAAKVINQMLEKMSQVK